MTVPPPGGSYKGRGDSESEDIGPPETEYGRAIRCDAADSGTLLGYGATGGNMGTSKMVGTDRDRMEAGAGAERQSGGSGRNIHGGNCRDDNSDNGDGDIRIGKGNGEEASLGASGSSGAEWSRAED